MVAEKSILKGLPLNVVGCPSDEIRSVSTPSVLRISPSDFQGMKFKVLVGEGDTVQRGSALVHDKKNPDWCLVSPVAGTVKEIVYGPRRSLQTVVIEPNGQQAAEMFTKYQPAQIASADGALLLTQLARNGTLSLIRRRPFDRPADPSVRPKSIFVNAMNVAPFRASAAAVIKDHEAAFQAGLDALTRLTDGHVFLCIQPDQEFLLTYKNVRIHAFKGPHPSGNTSTHIHTLDPILPGDCVWTLGVNTVVMIGESLLTGLAPQSTVVALGGGHVKESARAHYRVPLGAPLSSFLSSALVEGEGRVISGDIFYGDVVSADATLPSGCTSLVVLPEDRERHFMGWLSPGVDLWSTHRVFLSRWFGAAKPWSFGTSRRGSLRSMVLTGIYDRYVALDMMVEPLLRACIANDTDEAIRLGILESHPEDFALCSVVCPCKTDFAAIIQNTLNQIEIEGF
jgi:Na+-transporting NADH:ubiquinone oxidoreductase subunit A